MLDTGYTRRDFLKSTGAVALFSIGFCTPAGSDGEKREPFSFVQLCDPQLGSTDYKSDICSLEQAVKQINLLAPDFVLICGDLVEKANGTSISDFKHIIEAFSVPCYCVPGNHDVGLPATTESLSLYRKLQGKDYYAFTHKGCRFIAANTQLWKGYLQGESEQHDEWFARELSSARSSGLGIIVAGHYPPFFRSLDEGEMWQNLPLGKRDRVLQQLETCGGEVMITGHTHAFSEHLHRGTQLVSGESTSKNVDGRPLGFRQWQVDTAPPHEHGFIHLYKRALLTPKPPYDNHFKDKAQDQCIDQLRLIDTAKEYAAMKDGVATGLHLNWDDISDLRGHNLRHLKCPAGGNYEPGPLGEDPVCTIKGHQLPYFYEFREFQARAADQKRFHA